MASYNGKSPFTLPRPLRHKDGVNPETITVNKTLTYFDSQFQLLLNQTGSLDVVLPEHKDGSFFWIKSRASSSSNIIVKDGSDTVATLGAGEAVLVVSTDSAWWDVIKA